MTDREKLEEKIYYGTTRDLKYIPTCWTRSFDEAKNAALRMRENPLWDDDPIFIIEKTEHYEIVGCSKCKQEEGDWDA